MHDWREPSPQGPFVGEAYVIIDSLWIGDEDLQQIPRKLKGNIGWTDCIESCSKDDDWEAVGVLESDQWKWTVTKKKYDGQFSWMDRATGEPLFTLIHTVNEAFKAFIIQHIHTFLSEKALDARASGSSHSSEV